MVTLVPRKVVEALSPLSEKFAPAFTLCDFARASSSNDGKNNDCLYSI